MALITKVNFGSVMCLHMADQAVSQFVFLSKQAF